MTLQDDIRTIVAQCRQEILANMSAKDINASGRTAKSLTIEEDAQGIRLILAGTDHAPLETLEIGRPGGNVPGGFRTTKAGVLDVSNVFKAMLVQWGKDKGITDWGWGQATMLGRRIAAEGTRRHQHYEDVYSTPVNKAVKAFREDIRKSIAGSLFATKTHLIRNGR